MTPSQEIILFGTQDPSSSLQKLKAGALEMILEAGAVRNCLFQGVEIVRGIHFLLRDVNWGTPPAEIKDLTIDDQEDKFHISYSAEVTSSGIHFSYNATIEGSASGKLVFHIEGEAQNSFQSNRVGFTVLHPIPECAGLPVTVTHLNGEKEEARFPEEISPDQPIFDIHELRYEAAPGLIVDCSLKAFRPDGAPEKFEMEDQRNWSDASYKTYIWSLKDPWPVDVASGDRFVQTITFQCHGSAEEQSHDSGKQLLIGEPTGHLFPSIGLAIPEKRAGASADVAHLLKELQPGHLVANVHSASDSLEQEIQDILDLSERVGIPVHLEIILPCEDTLESELKVVGGICHDKNFSPAAVIPCPAAYLKSYQPDSQWPDVPELETIYAAAKIVFPDAQIGGGMVTNFTELNRKWPSGEGMDFVTHSTTPIVHAGDDLTIMENLTSLPWMVQTITSKLPGKKIHLGPSALSMRYNPYGPSIPANPENKRLAMAATDPRERALFGAAWTVGVAANYTGAELEALTLSATVGPSSVCHVSSSQTQPWFDTTEEAVVRPVFHILKGLAAGSGKPLRSVETAHSQLVALAWEDGEGVVLWMTNVSSEQIDVELPENTQIQILNPDSFVTACCNPKWLDETPLISSNKISLGGYEITRCLIGQ